MSRACCECTYITDVEGAVGVPTRPGHDSPEIGADGQGISGGHAPISIRDSGGGETEPGASSGISSMSLCNDLGAPSACSGDSARKTVEEVSAISQAVHVVCTRLRWELACAAA